MGRTNIEGDDIAAVETDTDSLLLGVYTAGYFGNFIVDATLMGHRGDNDHERSIASATPETVTGSNESKNVTLALGSRYIIQLSEAWNVVPNADSFVLTPDNDTLHTLEVPAGASWDRQLASGTMVSVSGGYQGALSGREDDHGARFALGFHW